MLRRPTPWVPVFLAALAVRLLFLLDSADNPVFWTPVVDAETYHRLARALAAGAAPGPELFWQPIFYPLFLAVVYAGTAGSMLAAKLVQAFLGAATCALTCKLGSQVFDRGTGLLAGWIVALYGPLVFYDGELLATGWACFWSAALLVLSLAALRGAGAWICFVLGVCGGLAALCQTNFLACLPLLLVALPLAPGSRRAGRRAMALRMSCLVAGLALVLGPAAAASARYAGRASLVPAAAGINLYIGNNPEAATTLALRPGWEWSELTRLPERHGVERKSETSAFFRGLVLDYARSHPRRFAAGLLGKSVQLASSRELPRNVDLYLFREWSSILRLLVWKIGPFGFPFGVLLPLALHGAFLRGSQRLAQVTLASFVVMYGATIVAVFVSGRHRAPLVPPLAVLAAASLLELVRSARTRRRPRVLAALVAGVVCAGVLTIPRPFPQEGVDYEQELLYLAGAAARKNGELDRALELLSAAVERDPTDSDAENQLGNAWADRGRTDLALRHYQLAAAAAPANALARDNHGRALLATGRAAEAAREFAAALQLRPRSAKLHHLYGIARLELGDVAGAVESLEQAQQLDPADGDVRRDLEQARAQGRLVPPQPP